MANGKSPYDLLTPMQQDFVNHYCICLNAAEAAEKAGFSAKTARQQGSKLLTKVNIMAAIEERRTAKAEELAIEEDKVLLEVASVLHTRLDEVVDWVGNRITVKSIDDIPLHARKAIKKIHSKEDDHGTTIIVEMHDKIRAAEFMGKYFGMTTGEKKDDPAKGTNPGDSAARGRRILESVRRMSGAVRNPGREGKSV